MAITISIPDVKVWTHWKNEKEKRVFLVVDVHQMEKKVVLMEVKYYKPDDARNFIYMELEQWEELTETKKVLMEFIPRIF